MRVLLLEEALDLLAPKQAGEPAVCVTHIINDCAFQSEAALAEGHNALGGQQPPQVCRHEGRKANCFSDISHQGQMLPHEQLSWPLVFAQGTTGGKVVPGRTKLS